MAMEFILMAATEAGVSAAEQFGMYEALKQGGPVAWATTAVLAIMGAGTVYVIAVRYWEQRAVLKEARLIDKKFWSAPDLQSGATKLKKNGAYRQVIEDALRAMSHHEKKLSDKIEAHAWLGINLGRSLTSISGVLQRGLSLLASVGSTAPFVGLFGTVIGILRALIKISLEGDASIDKVAGPVGEALIMTAIGLAVAVPAVLGYNWLIRRNKVAMEGLTAFANEIETYIVSGARMAKLQANNSASASKTSGTKT